MIDYGWIDSETGAQAMRLDTEDRDLALVLPGRATDRELCAVWKRFAVFLADELEQSQAATERWKDRIKGLPDEDKREIYRLTLKIENLRSDYEGALGCIEADGCEIASLKTELGDKVALINALRSEINKALSVWRNPT